MRVKQQEKLTDPLKSQKHLLFLVAQDDNKILWCVQKKSLQIYIKNKTITFMSQTRTSYDVFSCVDVTPHGQMSILCTQF